MNIKLKTFMQVLLFGTAVFLLSLFIVYPVQAADSIADGFSLESYAAASKASKLDSSERNFEKLKSNLYRVDFQSSAAGFRYTRIRGSCTLDDAKITFYSARGGKEGLPVEIKDQQLDRKSVV